MPLSLLLLLLLLLLLFLLPSWPMPREGVPSA
jgi:hypothetical protein